MSSMLCNVRFLVVGCCLLAGFGQSAHAQQAKQPKKGQQQAQQQPPKPQPQKPPAEPVAEDVPVQTRDYSKQEKPPEMPKPPQALSAKGSPEVAVGAGEGSPLAYGKRSVVELGGTLALTHNSDTTTFSLLPSIGYFVADGVELSLLPEFRIQSIDDETDYSIGGALEPSYHLAINRQFYAFAGLGIGLRYADDPGLDLFFRPELGLDIMIGRSGILKPALFLDVGVSEGASAGGLEASFTVML